MALVGVEPAQDGGLVTRSAGGRRERSGRGASRLAAVRPMTRRAAARQSSMRVPRVLLAVTRGTILDR